MTQLVLWPILVGGLSFLVVLRPAWTWGALLVGGLLIGDRLGVPLLVPAVAVTFAWLLWELYQLVTRGPA